MIEQERREEPLGESPLCSPAELFISFTSLLMIGDGDKRKHAVECKEEEAEEQGDLLVVILIINEKDGERRRSI